MSDDGDPEKDERDPIGKDLDARMGAMRNIWGNAQSPLDRVAAHVLVSRAARRVLPDEELQSCLSAGRIEFSMIQFSESLKIGNCNSH